MIGWIAAVVGGLLLVAVVLAGALVLYVRRAEQRSARTFTRLCRPLPPEPLPPLDTDPDGPRSVPLRSIWREL